MNYGDYYKWYSMGWALTHSGAPLQVSNFNIMQNQPDALASAALSIAAFDARGTPRLLTKAEFEKEMSRLLG